MGEKRAGPDCPAVNLGKQQGWRDRRLAVERCTSQARFPKLDLILAPLGKGGEVLAVLESYFFSQKLLSW